MPALFGYRLVYRRSRKNAMEIPPAHHFVNHIDIDAQETGEWLDALQAVVREVGHDRARFLLSRLSAAAQEWGVNWRDARNTPYINTIRAEAEPAFPGGSDALAIEQQLAGIMRWNALAMVGRANQAHS